MDKERMDKERMDKERMDKERMIAKVKHKIARCDVRINDLEERKENLSVHGYWSLGYFQGRKSLLEDALDDLLETNAEDEKSVADEVLDDLKELEKLKPEEARVIQHINDLSGDYKCYDSHIDHEESLILDRMLTELKAYRKIGSLSALQECFKR